MTTGTLTLRNNRFHYRLMGQGTPIVMVHGHNRDGDDFAAIADGLAHHWRVLVPDLRFHGASEGAPLLTPGPTLSPTLRPPPSATPSITPTPQPPFDIAQGPLYPIQRDDGVMTIWVKVFEGPPDNQKPLAGYVLKVFRNDVDVSKPAQSYAHIDFDHTSWNDPINDLKYNLKFELNNAGEVKWKIYLARPGGDRVSPVTEFTTLGDSYRNLVVYVAYWLAR